MAVMEMTVAAKDAVDALEEELLEMIEEISALDPMLNDVMIVTCMGYMARCTEIWLYCIRNEGRDRKLRHFRTAQLTKVMELLEFVYKGTSRLTELRRQDLELSR